MSNDQAAQEPIKLNIGEMADPKTCGSCIHFERRGEWNGTAGGYCNIHLPTHIKLKPYDPEGKPPNLVPDTYGCNFHEHTGKAYIVSKVLKP